MVGPKQIFPDYNVSNLDDGLQRADIVSLFYQFHLLFF